MKEPETEGLGSVQFPEHRCMAKSERRRQDGQLALEEMRQWRETAAAIPRLLIHTQRPYGADRCPISR